MFLEYFGSPIQEGGGGGLSPPRHFKNGEGPGYEVE